MVDVTPLIRSDQQVIQSYANGVFKVSNVTYEQPIIVTSEATTVWDINNETTVEELQLNDFKTLIDNADHIDVVLFGAGKTMAFLPKNLRLALKEAGLSVDVMDTGAACRTYNVLMAEGRHVACALLPSK
ncbi:MAG: Mth938-like domain-containing protein [Alcanivorax sp.]